MATFTIPVQVTLDQLAVLIPHGVAWNGFGATGTTGAMGPTGPMVYTGATGSTGCRVPPAPQEDSTKRQRDDADDTEVKGESHKRQRRATPDTTPSATKRSRDSDTDASDSETLVEQPRLRRRPIGLINPNGCCTINNYGAITISVSLCTNPTV